MRIQISKSGFIHLTRWLSAILVLIGHLRSLVFKDFKELNQSGLIIKVFYFITGFGHVAVIVFFVLSGYLIGRSVIGQFTGGRFVFKDYFIKRVSRLYAVLPVALLLTLLFDHLGNAIDRQGIYYHKFDIATLGFSVISRDDSMHFLRSLFMLQNADAPPLGSNGPLWSLSYEFWYYVLFPFTCIIIFYLMKRGIDLRMLVTSIVIIAILALFLHPEILTYYFIWLLGLIPVFVKLKPKLYQVIMPVLVLAYLALQKSGLPIGPWLADCVFALLFSLWMCVFTDSVKENRFYKVNEQLAGFSYSLYLIHFPFVLLGVTLLYNFFGVGLKMEFSLISLSIFILLTVAAMVFAFVISLFTERKTQHLANFLIRITNSKV